MLIPKKLYRLLEYVGYSPTEIEQWSDDLIQNHGCIVEDDSKGIDVQIAYYTDEDNKIDNATNHWEIEVNGSLRYGFEYDLTQVEFMTLCGMAIAAQKERREGCLQSCA